ncbi:hypothetical protein [Fictibacillus sp. NRS-1165]|uniref:hypothetical protein n=1 Tax=Fictibacillus sp. NRS-1165 TaxID=3144463 RepID=UPI003D1B226F
MSEKRKESLDSCYIGRTWVTPVRSTKDNVRIIRKRRNDISESSSNSSNITSIEIEPSNISEPIESSSSSSSSNPRYYWRYESSSWMATESSTLPSSSYNMKNESTRSRSSSLRRSRRSSSSSSSPSSFRGNIDSIMEMMGSTGFFSEMEDRGRIMNDETINPTPICNCGQPFNEWPMMDEMNDEMFSNTPICNCGQPFNEWPIMDEMEQSHWLPEDDRDNEYGIYREQDIEGCFSSANDQTQNVPETADNGDDKEWRSSGPFGDVVETMDGDYDNWRSCGSHGDVYSI